MIYQKDVYIFLLFISFSCFSVDFSKSCGENMTVTSAVAVVSPEHIYKVLPNCLKCEMLFIAEAGHQLSATFHTFGTVTGTQGQCSKNRVDVYNGDGVNTTQLLSSKDKSFSFFFSFFFTHCDSSVRILRLNK